MSFLKSFLKPLSKTSFFRRLIAFLLYCYVQLVFWTTRWQWRGVEIPQAYWQAHKPFIVCFWHSRLLLTAYAWRPPASTCMPFSMLISSHSDGEIIARTVGHLGIRWIPGSSSQQGAQAFRSLKKALQEGSAIGVTPDGPRGPRYQVSRGVIHLALRAEADILPLTFSVRRGRFLRSWDRFFLAFPGTRGVMWWGKPLKAATYKGRPEDMQQDLQQALMLLTQEADHVCGHETPL